MNPWTDLPTAAPYVLPEDGDAISLFNAKAPGQTRIELGLLPEPFVGRTNAPIILLTLNPGVSAGDFALHEDPSFCRLVRHCHAQEEMEYANYYLDPSVSGPGARWMHRIAGPLVAQFGARTVANTLTLIEYFPYHSARFSHGRLRLSSQDHTFSLVRDAVACGANIFITRGRKLWIDAVPELKAYPQVFTTRSVQNVVISAKNCPDGYPAAVSALRAAET